MLNRMLSIGYWHDRCFVPYSLVVCVLQDFKLMCFSLCFFHRSSMATPEKPSRSWRTTRSSWTSPLNQTIMNYLMIKKKEKNIHKPCWNQIPDMKKWPTNKNKNTLMAKGSPGRQQRTRAGAPQWVGLFVVGKSFRISEDPFFWPSYKGFLGFLIGF